MARPVFYDVSGNRGRWIRVGMALVITFVMTGLGFLLFMLMNVTAEPPVRLRQDAERPRGFIGPVETTTSAKASGPWLPESMSARTASSKSLVFGYYMPWDAPSRRSLEDHAEALDWLAPGLATVTGRDHQFAYEKDVAMHRILGGARKRPQLMPMVQNARTDGQWDGRETARLLADATARRRLLDQVEAMVSAEGGRGVMFDLEALPIGAHRDYLSFLTEVRARFSGRGWKVALAAPVADPDWDLKAYGRAADYVVLMAYDEHWMGGTPGPIASQPWFAKVVARAVANTGPEKAIVAIGSYAYDWSEGRTEPMSVADAWQLAQQADTKPQFDTSSGNFHFDYRKSQKIHNVWMLDAVSAANQRQAIDCTGAAGVALWRLGSEDPGVWSVLAGTMQPDLSHIVALPGVKVNGTGEIMRMDSRAAEGARIVNRARDGTIRSAAYRHLPSADVVQRVGGHRRQVALTFDDGPDPRWTPKLLDILKREHVPATFFVTGASALGEGPLLRRIIAQGSELGNHSTTHADMSRQSRHAVQLELNATERLVEAYTGRTMRLFRPPFLGDADPDRRDELHASRIAADMGYLTVGLNVDPLDWKAPGVDAIVARAVSQVEAGTAKRPAQVILLHDSGGDRNQTIAALPLIIRALRARGYTFVTASRLAGLEPEEAMPLLNDSERLTAHGTRGLFDGIDSIADVLTLLFVVVIATGMVRAVALSALAFASRHRDVPPAAPPHLVPTFVSVLIPAFNEARVIESSVRRILASTDIRIEVIVIDDGSSDGTSQVVREAFGIDPRVRLLTLENGGKARALNAALNIARGDIIIALDADTQFEPDTVAKLARWFADPAIGAVAGNAKVGNAINMITRWQAIEYVTAQNLERRALAALGAITVVPGAVGAWRRTALDQVGGYPLDTLAEDQDLTIAIQRAGWQVACDINAVAWTEAPETVGALFTQRFRWAYGTLQCLWKHRALIGRGKPRGLALIGLPQAIVFQLLFTLAAPLIDLALLGSIVSTLLRLANGGWERVSGDVLTMAGFWLSFTMVDLACGWSACRLDPREQRFPAMRMLMQRFGYRQLLYLVVLRAIFAALTGPKVGWGKLDRSGSVDTSSILRTSFIVEDSEPDRSDTAIRTAYIQAAA